MGLDVIKFKIQDSKELLDMSYTYEILLKEKIITSDIVKNELPELFL